MIGKDRGSGGEEILGESASGRKISVLVVDDEYAHRHLMCQLLRSVGFDVMAEADNGQEGLVQYALYKPQFIVLDMNMPKMSGLDMLIAVRKADPSALVIMCTSMDDKETVTSLVKAGASDYIVKPIDRPLVIAKLSAFVSRFELRR